MNLSGKITVFRKDLKLWLSTLKGTFSDSRGVRLLSCALVVQLVITGTLLWQSNTQSDFSSAEQFVSVESSLVDEVTIDDGQASMTLTRKDDQWRLSDEYESRASSQKVEQLVSSITSLKPGLPVANTSASHDQLQVSESSFQRRVTLKAGDEAVVDLLMGTSPGFRKSHVRQLEQNEVYAAKMNTFDVPVEKDNWLDKDQLAFGSVSGLRSGDIELEYDGDQWSIVKPENQLSTHEVDPAGGASLLAALQSLRVSGFAAPLSADESANATTASLEASADATSLSADESVDAPLVSDGSDQDEIEELQTHTLVVLHDDMTTSLIFSKKGGIATVESSSVDGTFSIPVTVYDKLSSAAIKNLIVESSGEAPVEEQSPQG